MKLELSEQEVGGVLAAYAASKLGIKNIKEANIRWSIGLGKIHSCSIEILEGVNDEKHKV